MMGRYLIYTPVESRSDEKRFDIAWHKFAEVCCSLHRDGLDYAVQLNLATEAPHIIITATGTATHRKQAATHRFTPPPPIPAKRCKDRAQEAEWFLPENRDRRNGDTTHWRSRQTRYQELSQMAEEHLRAEAEYWRELEVLSGQRQHFKPGRTNESFRADDEVAA
jgi:hypothetical protein